METLCHLSACRFGEPPPFIPVLLSPGKAHSKHQGRMLLCHVASSVLGRGVLTCRTQLQQNQHRPVLLLHLHGDVQGAAQMVVCKTEREIMRFEWDQLQISRSCR